MAIREITIDPKTSEDFQMAKFTGINPGTGARRTYTDSEMRRVHNMLSRWTTDGIDKAKILDNFNRFYAVFPETEMPQDLKTYIFITRPEMNLFDGSGVGITNSDLAKDNANDSRLNYLLAMNPEILNMLTDGYSSSHKLMPYLQSRAESLQIPDYQIRTSEMTVPFYNYKYTYPTVTNESITGGTFDITFRDDEDLRIMKMMQFWIYYQDAIMKNKLHPSKWHIFDNSYDFMCSVFEIVCDPTSERILFWAKYSGCFPTSVPLSNLSFNLRGSTENKVTINFTYIMVEAMAPEIIRDFQQATKVSIGTEVPVYDTTFGVTGESLVGCPVIVQTSDKNGLLLKWEKMVSGRSGSLAKGVPVLENAALASQRAAAFKQQTIPDTRYTYRGTEQAATPIDTSYKYKGLNSYLKRNTDSV